MTIRRRAAGDAAVMSIRSVGRSCIFAACLLMLSGCPSSSSKPPSTSAGTGSPSRLSEAASAKESSANPGDTPRASSARTPVGISIGSEIRLSVLPNGLPGSQFQSGAERGLFSLLETTGGGVAVWDIDRDGRCDVVCAGGGYPDLDQRIMRGYSGSLYRGHANLAFEPVSSQARFDASAIYNATMTTGDIDSDGFTDLIVTGYSGLLLFRNQGDGTLELVPGAMTGLTDTRWSSSAVLFDADGDANPDLYVARYADWSFEKNPACETQKPGRPGEKVRDYCGPREFTGLPDSMYANRGDWTFVDVTEESGVEDNLRGLGVLAADLDNDGDIDLYVTNDVDPNLLYRNEGNGKFVEIARRCGVACNDVGIPEGSMGIGLGDYNNDGRWDLWVTNYQNEIGALYRGGQNLLFSYASNAARIAATDEASVGWGTAFADMDLDGFEDLVVLNGHIELYPNGSTSLQRPQILCNMDGKFFRLASTDASPFLAAPQSCRSLTLSDFDHDGRVDFLASRMNDTVEVVTNQTQSEGASLVVRLAGKSCNRDANGALVYLKIGDRTWMRQMHAGGSYAGSHDRMLHFGIPASLKNEKGTLSIRWPHGTQEELPVDGWNRELLIVEGDSIVP